MQQQTGFVEDLWDPIDVAIYETVHQYKDPRSRQRGATGLAPRVNMQPGTLNNKANPAQEHQLTLRESVPIQLTTGDYRILHRYAAALGHVAYPLPDGESSDVELLTQYAAFHAAVGAKSAAIREALVDGRITTSELTDIRQCFDSMVRAGLSLMLRIEGLADER